MPKLLIVKLAGIAFAGTVGATVGYYLAQVVQEQRIAGTFAVWTPLENPPESPEQIIGAYPCTFTPPQNEDNAIIYLRSVAGTVYRFRLCASNDTGWETAAIPERIWGFECWMPASQSPPPYFKRLPAKVTRCWQIEWSHETVGDTSYIVLLEDDSVWAWRHFVGVFDTLAIAGTIILMGLISGIGTFSVLWRWPRLTDLLSRRFG